MYFVGDLKPISVMLSNIDSLLRTSGNYGTFKSPYQISIYLASGSLLTILPPLILYIFTQKYFTQSIERTGIVG
jgi:multiple sugar transport system permease protein